MWFAVLHRIVWKKKETPHCRDIRAIRHYCSQSIYSVKLEDFKHRSSDGYIYMQFESFQTQEVSVYVLSLVRQTFSTQPEIICIYRYKMRLAIVGLVHRFAHCQH